MVPFLCPVCEQDILFTLYESEPGSTASARCATWFRLSSPKPCHWRGRVVRLPVGEGERGIGVAVACRHNGCGKPATVKLDGDVCCEDHRPQEDGP
jgi:hypothetical protein